VDDGERDRTGPPLVGRDATVARVDAALRRSAGVLLVGEAGVGKSYLARGYAARGGDGTDDPAWVSGLRGLSERPLSALRPLLGPGPSPGQDAVDWAAGQLADAVGDRLLVVDDVDVLDDVSAAVLHRLATARASTAPPPLLMTLRSGRPLPDAVERMLVSGAVAQVRVPPLDEASTALLAEQLLGGPLHPGAAHELHTRSGGNPLFVRELVAAGEDAGAWTPGPEGWVLSGPVAAAERLEPLIAVRLEGLTPAARRVAEAMALLGPLPPTVLHALDLVGGVHPLTEAGLAVTERGAVGLRHPLFAEVLLAGMAPDAGDELVTAVLELGPGLDLPVATTAWVTAAALERNHDVPPDRLETAARMALSIYDPQLALRLADAAQRSGGHPGAAVLAAQAGAMLGRDEALGDLEQLSREADPEVREAANASLARVTVSRDEGVTASLALLQPHDSAGAEALRAAAHLRRAAWGPAEAAAERALELAADQSEWLEAAAICALLRASGHDVEGAVRLSQRGLALLDEGAVVGPHVRVVLGQAATLAAILHGDPALAERAATFGAAVGTEHPVLVAHRALCLGELAYYRGRVASAERHLESAASLFTEHDLVDVRAWTLGNLALAQAARGAVDRARESLRRARAVTPRGQVGEEIIARRAESWIAAAKGDLARASVAAWDLTRTLETTPVRSAVSYVDLARWGDVERVAPALSAVAPHTRSAALTAAARTVSGIAGHQAAEVLGGADDLERAGLRLWAADLLAVAARRPGFADPAGFRARALLLALACEDAATPALTALGPGLTDAQRQVARLAAQGLTNRQVGAALGISHRTAATHLHRVYKLLGVNTRDKLAGIAL
jgi:DNA-binding CsgD family transcriptional regulator